jgi:phage terminase Nu1 subunit (DNA packaging protein)
MQTNIEIIYQQHIKPLSNTEQIKLLAKIAEELANGKEETEPNKKRSIMELHGLGAEIWEGIDAQEYVNELRNEWEHRP